MKKLNGPLTLRRATIGFVAIATGGTALLVLASQLGITIDRPLWRGEFVEQVQPLNDARLLQLEVRVDTFRAEILALQAKRKPVPAYMIERVNRLQRQIDEFRRLAEKLR